MPKVTVLLPVYNGEKYLKEAIESILNQTFDDFEFIIINDGSTDDTKKIIESYNDKRIRVVNQKNKGLSLSLNIGISMSQGEYIARMDADDISEKDRLMEQVSFMDQNPEIGICGSSVILINELGDHIGYMIHPFKHNDIKAQMLFNCPLAHPTVIFRKSFLAKSGLRYNEVKSEDYDLWVRAVDLTKIANINNYLVKYRIGVGISNNIFKVEYLVSAQKIGQKLLESLGSFSEREINVYNNINNGLHLPDSYYLKNLILLFKKIKSYNLLINKYNKASLDSAIASKLLLVCGRINNFGILFNLHFLVNSFVIIFRLKFRYKKYLLKKIFLKRPV